MRLELIKHLLAPPIDPVPATQMGWGWGFKRETETNLTDQNGWEIVGPRPLDGRGVLFSAHWPVGWGVF